MDDNVNINKFNSIIDYMNEKALTNLAKQKYK